MNTPPLYLGNARLLDGSGGPVPDGPYALLIEGELIAAVAPRPNCPCQAARKRWTSRG